jgi:TATA-box binding protein (TBP) (component of TFIID and TFIIIB)
MELKDFVGKPCSAKVSYEFFPKKKTKIDLEKAKEELEKIGRIEINSKVLLIVVIDGKTISIFKNGKILVRGEKEEIKARKIAKKVCSALKESVVEKKGLFG